MTEPAETIDPSRAAAQPAPDPPAAIPGAPPARSRRFRRRWLVVLVGLVAIVAVLAVELPPILWPPASTTTIWEAISTGISDSGVPKQTALEAFAYLYDVQIPDVTVPSGVEGGDEPADGSGALGWVQAVWSQLSPAQQAVIQPFLQPGPTDTSIIVNPSVPAATPAPSPSA